MSNYKNYHANLMAAILLLDDMERLKIALANMEQAYKQWCCQVDLPMKYRKFNKYQLGEELFRAIEIHEQRREQREGKQREARQ